MKKLFKILIFLATFFHGVGNDVWATSYPTLGIPLQTDTPKFNALSSTFTTTKGSVALDLQFVYIGKNKFKCSDDSSIDGSTVICSGIQSGTKYRLTVKKKPADGTRISLKGPISAESVSASYKGPKGKLKQRKVTVAPEFDSNSISSSIILRPITTANSGKFTASTGDINSGYSGAITDIPLKGRIRKLKRNKLVKWSIQSEGNKVSFTGKEVNDEWIGKLTGNFGPAKFSKKPVTIPLVEYNAGEAARFYGRVSKSDGSSPAESADGVKVTLRSDRNNNGTIEDDETLSIITDDKGQFDQNFAVTAGQRVTVDFDLDGYSKTPKVFSSVSPRAEIPINSSLRKLDALTVSSGNASSSDGKLQLENLPPTIESINGKVFNPVTESSQFPGEFADNTGNLLISSVFSSVEAKDVDGNPVTELSPDTMLKMLVPKDTWDTLGDLSAGNNQIDVPLFSYDETGGEWKRSTNNGWLVDEAGAKLDETALANLKNKSYAGNVYAMGQIAHLSYWNIDWPIETHGCVSGELIDSSGNPVSGALVSARGISYTGTSSPLTTGDTGRFCVDVMRSEATAEDLNNNGITGEETQVALSAYLNGKYYNLGTHTIPPTPATCATSGCVELGKIKLGAEIEMSSSICTITGKVVYSGTALDGSSPLSAGEPISGATVFAYEAETIDELMVCHSNNEGCSFFTVSDMDGNFELKLPILLGAELWAYSYQDLESGIQTYWGSLTTQGCPTAPLSVGVDFYGFNN